jgi:hypothetical protein
MIRDSKIFRLFPIRFNIVGAIVIAVAAFFVAVASAPADAQTLFPGAAQADSSPAPGNGAAPDPSQNPDSSQAPDKPKVAVFPIGGAGDEGNRDKIGFAFRRKLDRDGAYDPIDGPTMSDMAAASAEPIGFDTSADDIKKLAADSGAVVLMWGDFNPGGGEMGTLRVKVLDLRHKDAKPSEIVKPMNQPTDLRFVTEEILETISGVSKFEHPSEISVIHDPKSDALWKTNPNLVFNGQFQEAKGWEVHYRLEKYTVKFSDALPDVDKVVIYRRPNDEGGGGGGGGGGGTTPVLAMNLSTDCAENNGMACLSDFIHIKPDTRYRLSFKYLSDGPSLHVFVKGYTPVKDLTGKVMPQQDYERQVPPSGPTHGKWVEIVDDCNPQNVAFPVPLLRIDLYAYLTPGRVMFKDVVLKDVGDQTRHAKDSAIKPPGDLDLAK